MGPWHVVLPPSQRPRRWTEIENGIPSNNSSAGLSRQVPPVGQHRPIGLGWMAGSRTGFPIPRGGAARICHGWLGWMKAIASRRRWSAMHDIIRPVPPFSGLPCTRSGGSGWLLLHASTTGIQPASCWVCLTQSTQPRSRAVLLRLSTLGTLSVGAELRAAKACRRPCPTRHYAARCIYQPPSEQT